MITQNQIDAALNSMILSASGWRGVFALDGDEESRSTDISEAHKQIVHYAAWAFADFIAERSGKTHPAIIIGMDTRPTGKAIAQMAAAALDARNCRTLWADVTAAPEIMAYARSQGESRQKDAADGFMYISASHNPIGHNGLKFGLLDGGVINADDSAHLIAAFRTLIKDAGAKNLVPAVNTDNAARSRPSLKPEVLAAYSSFIHTVISGDGIDAAKMNEALKQAVRKKKIGIVCDFNGSARAASIDRDFFKKLDIAFAAINDTPGAIAHRIVPEGESLSPCANFLKECRQKNNAFIAGYVPDCDGDRGNLVIWDEECGAARPLEAQEVFALACLSELSHLAWTGQPQTKIAIAVNDATSMRVDRIAALFGAEVFRAEIGEANVVSLARKLRNEGYTVRILGEGAAGGNITHPSSVRDPLSTVMALLKLMVLPRFFNPHGSAETPANLNVILASLPRWTTTSTYAPHAVLRIKTSDHGALKRAYQDIFIKEWDERRATLFAPRGIISWKAFRYNGMIEANCDTDFAAAGKGGLKINFYNEQGTAVAAIWMRGSGTEPVFRVMADVEGSEPDFENELICWQRRMTLQADNITGVIP